MPSGFGLRIGIPEGSTPEIAQAVIDQYKGVYPELAKMRLS